MRSRFDHKYVTSCLSEQGIDNQYVHFHKYRYALILNKLHEIKKDRATLQLLDVGPSYQTLLIRKTFPDFAVHTLGTDHPNNEMRDREKHWVVDLNYAERFDCSKVPDRVDILLYAEVLEHLYTKPAVVLSFLKQFIVIGGHLILQTPNAVSLDKRLKMFWGKNPYQQIALSRRNHYREYTKNELHSILVEGNFQVLSSEMRNYFNPNQTLPQKLYRKFERFIPSSLRDGITIVATKIGRAG